MPRLRKMEEGDLEANSIEPENNLEIIPEHEPEPMGIVPMDQTHSNPLPNESDVVEYVAGNPITAGECYEFGKTFMGLYAFLFRTFGFDRSPPSEKNKLIYLRVTCPNCTQVTVTPAPHVEKYCSGCGHALPDPSAMASNIVKTAWEGDGEVIEAEFEPVSKEES